MRRAVKATSIYLREKLVRLCPYHRKTSIKYDLVSAVYLINSQMSNKCL